MFTTVSDFVSESLSKLSGENEIGTLKADGSLLKHYALQALSIFTELHVLGLISAFFVFAVWYFYIRSLDFFDQEKLKFTVLIVVLGAITTLFTFPLSDFVHGLFNIE